MGHSKAPKPVIYQPPPPPPKPENTMNEMLPIMMQMMQMMQGMTMMAMRMPHIPAMPEPSKIEDVDWEAKRKKLEEEVKKDVLERQKKGMYATILTDLEDWTSDENYPVLLSELKKVE